MEQTPTPLARALRAAATPANLPYTLLGFLAAVSIAARLVLTLR
jgi:hypothetical protein